MIDYYQPITVSQLAASINISANIGNLAKMAKDINKKAVLSDYKSIVKRVCKVYHITEEQIMLKTRDYDIVKPRQIAHYLIKNCTNLSKKEIGINVGNVDRNTVLHSITTISNYLETDKNFREFFYKHF